MTLRVCVNSRAIEVDQTYQKSTVERRLGTPAAEPHLKATNP